MEHQTATSRAQVLSRLPLEAKQFLLGRDRNAVQLADLSNGKTRENTDIKFRPQEKEVIRYYCLANNVIMTEDLIARLSIIGTIPLYMESGDEDEVQQDQQSRYFGAMLSVLTAYCSSNAIQASSLIEHLRGSGFLLAKEVLTADQLREQSDDLWEVYKELAGMDNTIEYHCRELIVIGLSSLLLIAKRLSEASVTQWFDRRWRALASLIRCPTHLSGISKPEVSACNGLNNFMASLHKCRKSVFTIIRALAAIDENRYKAAFDSIVRNMWWAEATHLGMIDEHICRYNPEILAFPEFMGPEKLNLSVAYQILMKLNEEDRPFIRLLLPPEECVPLQSRHFTTLYAAARAIATIDNPTIANLQTANSDSLKSLGEKVANYVRAKRDIGPLGAAAALEPNLTKEAYAALLTIIKDNRITEEGENVALPEIR
ncbi:putative nucleocapsid protein [Anisopteromalus calandrae negative-strand RNA virus 1]|uniref:Nucleocapsid protein n=1 Tax=Anisopteromalus calandrae negative-strand RNA virus 1 TaxID=2848909 RepID=A0AAE7S0P9_9MONO|nr:putative nucleocapsid protein [Anisopteromalus calandrae negative-strand RNA virus 1]QWT43281.1 putative nucleocapsid protein [Anisopteromalus calandrae negative-strand RNA virus 1]